MLPTRPEAAVVAYTAMAQAVAGVITKEAAGEQRAGVGLEAAVRVQVAALAGVVSTIIIGKARRQAASRSEVVGAVEREAAVLPSNARPYSPKSIKTRNCAKN